MYNKSRNLKINLSNFLYLNALLFHFNTYAQNSSSREWVSSINNLIGAVRSMSPVLFMLGLVFLIATVGIWIWFPRFRQQTSWVWGSIVLIIVVYFVGSYFAEPLRNTFSAVLDPIKWISPSGG
jgi:sterol desaturase/sphingolipid hydroxylase (fatty acid hydroxylase superfamily)